MSFKQKKRHFVFLILICIALQPVFAQTSPQTNSDNEILLVNSFRKRLLPNLSRKDWYSYDYSIRNDSLIINIIPKTKVLYFKDCEDGEQTTTNVYFTNGKEMKITLPSDVDNRFNVVFLSLKYKPVNAVVDQSFEYTFIKLRKDNFFKLRYLNKNAKRHLYW